jgi:MFS family permease
MSSSPIPPPDNPGAKRPTGAHAANISEPADEARPGSAALPEGALRQEFGTEEHDAYAAWRSRDYRIFAVGTTTLSLGFLMVSTAINYQLFHLTQLDRSVGWLGLVQATPVILLSLVAGHVADTWSRKRVMLATVLLVVISSLCLAFLTWAHLSVARTEAALLILAAAESCASTFFRPARNAMLPALVAIEHFPNAVAWNSTLWEVASVSGPAIAGWLLALNSGATYAVAAVLQVCMVPAVLMLRAKEPQRQSSGASIASLIAGVRFVLRTKQLLGAMTLDMIAVLFGGVTFLLPIFADRRLHVGAVGFGFLRCAPSIGAVAMAIRQAHARPMRRAGITLLIAVAGFGAATIVFAFSKNYWLSLFMLMLTGALDNISVVVRQTLVQLLTPDHMRGRVSAVNNVFIGSSNELGGLESGLTAAAFGIVISAAGGGILSIVTVVMIAALFPELRRLGRLADLKPVEANADGL